jgi:anion-transporting  ArsA/GET3 family ATPase
LTTTSVPELLERQLHFVTGKGGVGRSTLACALATALVRKKKKTLLVQINAPDSHSALLGIDAVGPEITRVQPNLWVVNIRPKNALREYVIMKLKFERLYKVFFDNSVVRAFLRFIPSLAELNMMGKIWFHAEERDAQGQRVFDRIVVDGPATGHSLGFLQVAQVINRLVPAGPMADETARMVATLNDLGRTAVHVCTLAEEMPVNETLELLHALAQRQVAPLGILAVNRVVAPLFGEAERGALERLPQSPDPLIAQIQKLAQRRMIGEALQEEMLAKLAARVPNLPRVVFPVLAESAFGPQCIGQLADVIDGAGSEGSGPPS